MSIQIPPQDYEYDVFFSYKRHPQMLDWTRRVYELFKFQLTLELGGIEARVFFDEREIEVGQRWPDELRGAIRQSKCLVCIWSPIYFQSTWCVSEWRSFLAREQALGANEKIQLIAPLKYHDGEHFPQEARDTQWRDVSEFTSSSPAFLELAEGTSTRG